MAKRRVLNVGGNNKQIPIPEYYADFEHLIADIDDRADPDLLIDARHLNETEADAFDAIYCSHNLEHFFAHDVQKVLSGFRHVLKLDGFVEIMVPDIKALMLHMTNNDLELDQELYKTKAGQAISARDMLYGWGYEIECSAKDFYAHKTGFSQKTLQHALNETGFPIVVFRPGRFLEIYALAFQQTPSEFQKDCLDLTI